MRLLRAARAEEVVLEFLLAEVRSSRFRHLVQEGLAAEGADESVIERADLEDGGENEIRRRVLARARSWMSGGELFVGFPQDVAWWLAELDEDDIRRVLYIDYADWLDVSGGTRLAVDAAGRIRARETWYAQLWDSIPARAIATDPNLPRLILVGERDGSKLVLLEGHLRFTAFFVADAIPTRLEVFLGTSAGLKDWPLY